LYSTLCGKYEGEGHTGVEWGNLKEGDHLEDIGVQGRIVIKWIFKNQDEGSWTGLTWPRIWWWAFVNTVMKLRGSIKCR
jgi:hypothetical protein